MKKFFCTVVFALIGSLVFAQGENIPDNFVLINGGTFTMGSPANEQGRERYETQRQVTVSSFYMGKYEVTQKEWFEVMGLTARQNRDMADRSLWLFDEGDNYPMYNVSWYDALVFCNKLSMREGLTPAYSIGGKTNPSEWGAVPTDSDVVWDAVVIVAGSKGYRLPTAAEWEYACRAGTTTTWYCGDTDDNLGEYAWIETNSDSESHEVGKKKPNAFGLYDMHGNVFEWCWDLYREYSDEAKIDSLGGSSRDYRVFRGGGYFFPAMFARSALQSGGSPFVRFDILGFRLVRSAQ